MKLPVDLTADPMPGVVDQLAKDLKNLVNFDSDQIQPLICVKLPNSWSLPVVTLTCILITLPNMRNDIVDSLFCCVGEGLSYTLLVEESLK
ncbi:hypothetical protein L6452_17464 [Arctium lappa]|uniref:Uncharacterized protein n=1 Tax=Arctium lappa TaxID=4217 RepID=A0ACB9C3N5_ARCLA|nr:hypothetical protein L6452_17464 [Arctium lappa]